MSTIDSTATLNEYLETWQRQDSGGQDQTSILIKIAELVEHETEAYLKMDPDPFDDRHPSRARPDCSLGAVLKALFRNDDFMNKLVNNYVMARDDLNLQIESCRLMLDILPGLETSVVFNETEGLVQRLFSWAESASDPLQSYATGLLAAAMEVQDIAVNFKEQNTRLLPIMLRRLKQLKERTRLHNEILSLNDVNGGRNNYFTVSHSLPSLDENSVDSNDYCKSPHKNTITPPLKRRRLSSPIPFIAASPPVYNSECSNSSWADVEPFMIGSSKIYPLTDEMRQRFILQYLTPMGDYQELLCYVFEHHALALILHYINLKENHDIRLAFDALKYLASLLCHKKFALEFLNSCGLQKLLQVCRPSVAATGVSICLYYLAYNEDAMEKICLLPKHVLNELVSYALWLLECSHDSSRCHATMFFSLSFPFRVILELFDNQDGLRKLLNVIFLLDIFSDENDFTEDELFTKRQTIRHVCVALKRYYEAHLVIEAELLRRSSSASSNASFKNSPNTSVPYYKAARFSPDVIREHVEMLLELMPIRINWKPVDELIKLAGVKLLIQLIAVSFDWNYTGKAEAVRSALDVLVVCSVTPKFQAVLCENVPVSGDEGHNTVGMRIILAAAEGEIVSDADCQRSALNVIINCVCGPLSRIGGSIARLCAGSAKKRSTFRSGEDLLSKMWNCVRANNGIMILLNLLSIKTPITDADSIRALCCKALCGLARSETVKQIIGKLPLFTNGQLQGLMKEPILQDKRAEHIKFCKYCMELIERITGAPVATNLETSITNINKAEVVAQTKIIFNQKELLQLIHHHLVNKGLNETANILQKEASLPVSYTKSSQWSNLGTPRLSRLISTTANSLNTTSSVTSSACIEANSNTPSPSSSQVQATSQSQATIPIRINRTPNVKSFTGNKNAYTLQKSQAGVFQPSPVMKRFNEFVQPQITTITLESIITEYLRKQHGLCKNPVVTCPPFDLFVPHRCPEPLNRNSAPMNLTMRLQRRELFPPFGGLNGSKMDRRYIYSKFRPVRTYRNPESNSSFSSCAFSYYDQFLFLGTVAGELAAFNLHTGTLEATYNCHESEITRIEPSKDGKLILTSSVWRSPLSALWTFTDVFETKMTFRDDVYVEFGKQSQDKVLGTKEYLAHLYDLNTTQLVSTFHDENLSNKYQKNRATFHPSDELILNDGILWDVRSVTPIHKFDKFNQHINGVFHPNGHEIISNSEIWDIRTFHLLKTVPALDQCRIKFNSTGEVIYGGVFEEESSEEEDQTKSPFGCSFRTFDATDYSGIATIDVKRSIFDLAVDPGDCYIALVENQNSRDLFANESVARLFEIGRSKEDDDEEEEEEEDENDVDDDEDDSDDNLDNTDDFEVGSDNENESGDESAAENSNEDEIELVSESDSDSVDIDSDLLLSDHSSDDDIYQINV